MVEAVVSIVVLLIQIFLGIVFGIVSVYLALRFFDKMTEGIDEIKELKKGNIAIAIVLLSLIVSIGTIVSKGIERFAAVFSTYYFSLPIFFIGFVLALIQLLVVLIVAIIAIYVAIRVLDTMTYGIGELKELKRGNVAVAILVASVIYVISFIIANAISGIGELAIFKPEVLAMLLGMY